MVPVEERKESTSRFIVGIDLGTTNCAVAYVDTLAPTWRVEVFVIPQVTAPGLVEKLVVLPSFHYEPMPGEFARGSLCLPWHQSEPPFVVGVFAKEHGALHPGRLIHSAKSWLCHGGVDRQAPLLPWFGSQDVTRISPVEASARYLRHIREAWDWQFPQAPLAEQDVVLTLPASFDEIARELTVRAAQQAGIPRVTLIEEPQAAFYAWMYLQGDKWKDQLLPHRTVLVCDIGGGTTDFTLIRVLPGKAGDIRLERIAVGEHLILGGDNFDLALAHFIEKRVAREGQLDVRSWGQLVNHARRWKELMLGDYAPEEITVHVPGSGGRVIGGGFQLQLRRNEVEQLLVEGFFPKVPLDAEPSRVAGFREFGLPFAPDPAVTRYLAAFLRAHRHAVEDASCREAVRPDFLLFNGGVFESSRLRRRVVEVIESWFRREGSPDWSPRVLQGDRLDLAVARGAAYYGIVRRGRGVRIGSGLPRSYYIAVGMAPSGEPSSTAAQNASFEAGVSDRPCGPFSEETHGAQLALCIVPAGLEPGEEVSVDQVGMELLLSQPVEFPLFASTTRTTDRPGQLVPISREHFTALASLRTVLRHRRRREAGRIPVRLHARVTEIGTLDLWVEERERKITWKLQFDVRKTYAAEVPAAGVGPGLAVVEESVWESCERILEETFGEGAVAPPEGVMKSLSVAIGTDRMDWPITLLRRMWEALIEREAGRRRSPTHEARWLNLVGFVLRPGFGVPLDDWRVEETWRQLQGKLVHHVSLCRTEWFVMWRRIAGGLPAGCQQALAEPLVAVLRNFSRQFRATGHGNLPFSGHEGAEMWRLLGALELLPAAAKAEIGWLILELLSKQKFKSQRSALLWALARIGAREPSYGPLNCVVHTDIVAEWLEQLLKLDAPDPHFHFAVMQLSRRTGDRFRDLPDRLRSRVAEWLRKHAAKERLIELVLKGGKLARDEAEAVLGDRLPLGLRLV